MKNINKYGKIINSNWIKTYNKWTIHCYIVQKLYKTRAIRGITDFISQKIKIYSYLKVKTKSLP